MTTCAGDAFCECGEELHVSSPDGSYVSGAVVRFLKEHEEQGHRIVDPYSEEFLWLMRVPEPAGSFKKF